MTSIAENPPDSADAPGQLGGEVKIPPETLAAYGLVRQPNRVKVLGNGALTKTLIVKAHAFSASAKEKIAAAGGTAEEIGK